MKPRIKLDDGITPKEYETLASRWEEMLSLGRADDGNEFSNTL